MVKEEKRFIEVEKQALDNIDLQIYDHQSDTILLEVKLNIQIYNYYLMLWLNMFIII